jgi:hypothetical protein
LSGRQQRADSQSFAELFHWVFELVIRQHTNGDLLSL